MAPSTADRHGGTSLLFTKRQTSFVAGWMRSSGLQTAAIMEVAASTIVITRFLLALGAQQQHELQFVDRIECAPASCDGLEQPAPPFHRTEGVIRTTRDSLPDDRAGEQSRLYDLCFLSQKGEPQQVRRLLKLALGCLLPGGWLVMNSVRVDAGFLGLRHQDLEQAEDGASIPAPDLFTSVIEHEAHFGAFRKIEGWGFAQKQTQRRANQSRRLAQDRLIAHALECAHHDPDFREALLRTPRKALELLAGHSLDWTEQASFREALTEIYPGADREGQTYLLRTPAWLPRQSRRIVLKQLASCNTGPTMGKMREHGYV